MRITIRRRACYRPRPYDLPRSDRIVPPVVIAEVGDPHVAWAGGRGASSQTAFTVRHMADIRELYPRRVEAASIALGRGDRSEAERLYAEALTMGEESFGAKDPALAVPLNELSRLYVRRSEYARAEPLLERLLEIRRASGEHHPDVATVHAGLAAVRRGLGDDAAAEGLYRQALAIREKVHAPDHMAVVVTVEQLADTCAALRKFDEARTLFERALSVRETVLGADHQSARGLRERLAALPAKAAAIRPEPPRLLPEVTAAPAPEELGVSGELVFLYEPEKPKRRASLRRDRVMTPPFSAAVAAASLISVPAHATAPSHAPAPTQTSAPSLALADQHEFDAAIMPRADERVAPHPLPRRSQPIESPVRGKSVADRPTSKRKRNVFAAGGLVMVASAGLLASSRLPGRTSEAAPRARASEPVASFARALTARRTAVAAAPVRLATARLDSARLARTKPVSAAPAPKAAVTDPQVDARIALAAVPVLPTIGSVVIPETNAPNADSVMRASTTRHDTDTDQIVSPGRLRAMGVGEDRAETSPVLIGVAPQPRFPDGLRAQGVGGDVVVQFLVAADGSVDASTMKVVRSPHELFTAAVRNVLPKFHFQPARTADAKPHAEWVQYSIQFSATK